MPPGKEWQWLYGMAVLYVAATPQFPNIVSASLQASTHSFLKAMDVMTVCRSQMSAKPAHRFTEAFFLGNGGGRGSLR